MTKRKTEKAPVTKKRPASESKKSAVVKTSIIPAIPVPDTIPLDSISVNPRNPRQIHKPQFERLKKSLIDFVKMMALRPIVVNSDGMILGGNMRYVALKELGYTEIPKEWVKVADELTEDEQRRFVVEDNVEFGAWNIDILSSDYEVPELIDLGISEFELGIKEEMNFEEAWKGMPEFGNTESAYKSIAVHFESPDAVKNFAELVEQNITEKTKSIWYPKKEKQVLKDLEYTDES